MHIIIFAVIGVLYASVAEWLLHRFVMHQPVGKFTYPYDAHTRTHHHMFKADRTYHLVDQNIQNKRTIPMAWWNWIFLVPIAASPFMLLSLFSGYWSLTMTVVVVVALYYAAYEYIHWCMHLPGVERRRLIERSWVFFRLNGHHLLHHRYMHKNFNVVFPFADFLLGTLLLRSKVCFAQATGPSVPDVQPKQRKRVIPFLEFR